MAPEYPSSDTRVPFLVIRNGYSTAEGTAWRPTTKAGLTLEYEQTIRSSCGRRLLILAGSRANVLYRIAASQA